MRYVDYPYIHARHVRDSSNVNQFFYFNNNNNKIVYIEITSKYNKVKYIVNIGLKSNLINK